MSQVIHQETVVFLVSVLHGAVLAFVYDILRSLRRAFVHNLAVVSIEDFLYWMAAGFLTFCLAFLKTDGVIRGYVAVGIGIGVVLYHNLFACLVVKGLTGFWKLMKKVWGFFWNLLAAPVRKTGRIWKKIIVFARKTGYNLNKMHKKRHRRNADRM